MHVAGLPTMSSQHLFIIDKEMMCSECGRDASSVPLASVYGFVRKLMKIAMAQLVEEFKPRQLPITLVCARNRRKEKNQTIHALNNVDPNLKVERNNDEKKHDGQDQSAQEATRDSNAVGVKAIIPNPTTHGAIIPTGTTSNVKIPISRRKCRQKLIPVPLPTRLKKPWPRILNPHCALVERSRWVKKRNTSSKVKELVAGDNDIVMGLVGSIKNILSASKNEHQESNNGKPWGEWVFYKKLNIQRIYETTSTSKYAVASKLGYGGQQELVEDGTLVGGMM
eukprot:Gb_03107 [translate_table: standard]